MADFGGSGLLRGDLQLLVHAEVLGRQGLLHGTLDAPVVAGVAVFTDLRLDEAGPGFVLSFTASGPAGPMAMQSPEFRVLPPVRRLVVAEEPSAAARAGLALRPPPAVYLMDADSAFVALSRRLVGASLRSVGDGVGGSIELSGQSAVLAEYGVARFQDLAALRAGSYVLEYRLGLGGPALATSAPFTVIPSMYAAARRARFRPPTHARI